MRYLDLKQSVALNLIYLAKGYQNKFKNNTDNFIIDCADLALKYDSLNLNAMLLKAEVLEKKVLEKNKVIAQLQSDKDFIEYEKLIVNLYTLGYREMPLEMKNILISGCRQEDAPMFLTDHTPSASKSLGIEHDENYITLSNGLFDEMHEKKDFEKYSRIVFDTKKNKIVRFISKDSTYNNYNFDPVLFALSIDPLASKYPYFSPYCFVGNSPIILIDEDGREPIKPSVTDVKTLITVLRENKINNFNDAATFFGGNQTPLTGGFTSATDNAGEKQRYVYTKGAGWIDFKHFFDAADLAEDVGWIWTVERGETTEKDQLNAKNGSAYDYDDLQSNFQGAIFGQDFRALEGEEFLKVLEGRLNALGATDPKSAPNYNDLKDNYDTDSGEQVTDYEPVHTTPGYNLPKWLTKEGRTPVAKDKAESKDATKTDTKKK